MYILMDHVGRSVHPLGEKPLAAMLEFCDYMKRCQPEGGQYPPGCEEAAFETFSWEVTDGTASELFRLIAKTSEKVRRGTSYRRIFEVAVVPRPGCWQCDLWKADGTFCMKGEREQSSEEPACQAWRPPSVAWKDIRSPKQPQPRRAAKLTDDDWESLQSLIAVFMEEQGGVVSLRDLKRRFRRSDPATIQTALKNMIAEGMIAPVQPIRKGPGPRPTLYRLTAEMT